jgi:hypothetical protein
MNREITVILKKPDSEKPNLGTKVWNILNEVIKSSLFSFFFGASFVAFLPWFQEAIKTEKVRKAQEIEQEARSDAILVAPFIANLDATQPQKSRAVIAALQELDRVSKEADENGQSSPIFKATVAAMNVTQSQIQSPVSTNEDPNKLTIADQQSTQETPSTLNPGDIYQT